MTDTLLTLYFEWEDAGHLAALIRCDSYIHCDILPEAWRWMGNFRLGCIYHKSTCTGIWDSRMSDQYGMAI